MKLSMAGLRALLDSNVVELKFIRRHLKPGFMPSRRMLCTNNRMLLNSIPGKITLHFQKPIHPPPYRPEQHNLVFAWDIFQQQYRAISMESCDIVGILPLKSEEDINKFWMYFNEYLYRLTPVDKIKFMNG